MKHLPYFLTAFFIVSGSSLLQAGSPSAPYADSRVDARLNVQVNKDTDILHFVRANADAGIVTKTYVLKHADPYEIRGYLEDVVLTKSINTNKTNISAIKYNDGTGIVMITAEDYRFDSSPNGQGIDSIVATLDQPKIVSNTGQATYLYFPRYRSGSELKDMVQTAGADVAEDLTENLGGSDRISFDEDLNLMFFKTTQFSRKNITEVLQEYDRPYPEVKAKITVYELYAENDTKLGMDFQAWKNNDGIDLFNAGARFRQNYNTDGSQISRGTGWSDTSYYNFNPKWNTKYIDFLTSKGKAKIVHECEITARNRNTAQIAKTTQVFVPDLVPIDPSEYTVGYIYLADSTFAAQPPSGKTPVAGWQSEEIFVLKALSTGGHAIKIKIPRLSLTTNATLTILQNGNGSEVKYFLSIKDGSFEINGVDVGQSVEAGHAEVLAYHGEADDAIGTYTWTCSNVPFNTSANVTIPNGNQVFTTPSNEFGFRLSMTPSITQEATLLDMELSNSSLIGYTSTGSPRIQQGAKVSSTFLIANDGTKLVIGGLEKRDTVSVSGGVPFLKDIPGLGWIFATESETTKKSQLLVVAEVVPVFPNSGLDDNIKDTISKLDTDLEDAGEENTYGYHQYLLDPER